MSSEQQNSRDSSAFRDVDVHAADAAIGRSLALVRFLRDHCQWDARQTPQSLRPYLLEEAHEVADAILAGDGPELAGELGDLLLNVAYQIVLGEERGAFDAATVTDRLEAKMRARHPHVYGDDDELPDWEALKAAERSVAAKESAEDGPGGGPDPFEGLPAGMEPLSRALRLQDRAAALNFDWPDATGATAKLREELEELEELVVGRSIESSAAELDARLEDELGDVLFSAVNVARLTGIHPSNALEHASAKFTERFRAVLDLAADRGVHLPSATLEELDVLWEEVKAR